MGTRNKKIKWSMLVNYGIIQSLGPKIPFTCKQLKIEGNKVNYFKLL